MKIFGGFVDGGESVYLDFDVEFVEVDLSILAAVSLLPLDALVLAMTSVTQSVVYDTNLGSSIGVPEA
jgi:hypothetical protein